MQMIPKSLLHSALAITSIYPLSGHLLRVIQLWLTVYGRFYVHGYAAAATQRPVGPRKRLSCRSDDGQMECPL